MPNTGEPKNWVVKLVVATALSTIVSTSISTGISTSASFRTACRDKLLTDQQEFFRLATEANQRVNEIAFDLTGTPISQPHLSDADIDNYIRYFSRESPYVISERYKNRSFDDIEFDLHDISERWYRLSSYWSDDYFAADIHPIYEKLQIARGLRAYLLSYANRHEPQLLGFSMDEAKKFLNFPSTWQNDAGKYHEIRELGGNCYPWPTIFPRWPTRSNSKS